MRYRKLTILNLLTIAHAEIDFEQQLSSDHPLFLITGDTGSGKSTILDAICLALFGASPRMRGSRNESYSIEGEDRSVVDLSQLMRRHTVECQVELAFEGNDGRYYVATWGLHRARYRVNGTIQQHGNTIRDIVTGEEAKKKNELEELRARIIGVTYEQFLRTSLLAQGDFTRFLYSKPDEKSEILEKLTGTEIYSRIGSAIYRRKKELQAQYDALRSATQQIVLLTPEEREQMEQKRDNTLQTVNEQKAQKEKIHSGISITQNIEMYKERLTLLGQSKESAKQAVQDPNHRRDEEIVRDFRDSEQLRQMIHQERQKYAEVIEQQHRVQELDVRCTQLHRTMEVKDEEVGRSRVELSEIQCQLDSMSQQAPIYMAVEYIAQEIERLAYRYREYTATATHHRKLQELAEQYTDQRAVVDVELSTLQQTITYIEESYCQSSRVESNEQLLLDQQTKAAVQRYHSVLSYMVQKLIPALGEADNAIVAQRKAIDATSLLLQELRLRETKAAQEKEQAQQVYHVALMAANEVVSNLKQALHEGELCPICGGVIHETIPDDIATTAAQELKAQYDIKSQLYDTIHAEVRSAEIELNTLTTVLLSHEHTKQKLTTEFDGFASELMDRRIIAHTDVEELSEKLQVWCSVVQMAERAERIHSASERVRGVLEQQREAHRKRHEEHTKSLNDLKEQLSANSSEQAVVSRQMEAQQQEIHELQNTLRERLMCDQLPDASELPLLAHRLKQEAEHYQKLHEHSTQLAQSIDTMDATLQETKTLYEETRRMVRGSYRMLQEGIGEDYVPLQSNDSNAQLLSLELQELRSIAKEIHHSISLAHEQIARCLQEMRRLTRSITEILGATGRWTKEQVEELMRYSTEQIGTMERECHERRDRLRDISTQIATTQTTLEEQISQYDALGIDAEQHTLSTRYAELRQLVEDNETLLTKLRIRLTQDDEQHTKQADYIKKTEAMRLEYDKWTSLSQLMGDSEGKKMRSIAQAFILDQLLRTANAYLVRFSDRYQLTTAPGSLAILVTDSERGYIPQSANVLSGGEGFMVSLSLALALSEMNSGDSYFDLLFIDEGFGTLDAESLDMVMSALETLHSIKDRRVGIISHVRELKERIPMQIRVARSGPNQSQISIVDTTRT